MSKIRSDEGEENMLDDDHFNDALLVNPYLAPRNNLFDGVDDQEFVPENHKAPGGEPKSSANHQDYNGANDLEIY